MPNLGRPRNNACLPEDLKFSFVKVTVIVLRLVHIIGEAWSKEVCEFLKAVSEFLNFLWDGRVRGNIRRRQHTGHTLRPAVRIVLT